MDILQRLNFTLDSRFPAFSDELYLALKKAGLADFPHDISDEQVEAALVVLNDVYDAADIATGDYEALFGLFVQSVDRAAAKTWVASRGPLDHAQTAREIVRSFILQAARFNDELNALLDTDEGAFDALYLKARLSSEAEKEDSELAADRYRFFSEPEAVADFASWALLVPWTPEQAVALSLGKNPDVVNSETLAPHIASLKSSPFAANFRHRTRYLQAAVRRGDMKSEIYPNSLLRWAAKYNLEVDPGLISIASKTDFDADEMDLESENDPSPATWRTLVFGLLKAYYDFPDTYGLNPGERSPYAGRVLHDLGEVGVPLSDKPLRDALRAAAAWARDPKNEVKKTKSPPKLWREAEAAASKPPKRTSARP